METIDQVKEEIQNRFLDFINKNGKEPSYEEAIQNTLDTIAVLYFKSDEFPDNKIYLLGSYMSMKKYADSQ